MALAVVGMALLAAAPACSGSTSATNPRTNAVGIAADPDFESSMRIQLGSQLVVDPVRFSPIVWGTDFSFHTIPYDEIWSGGAGKNAVPVLDSPTFEPVASAGSWIAPQEPVIALEVAGVAKAYPIQILIWHEIVNDSIAGTPVSVTFCPLCNSAVVFDRRFDGTVLDFGVTGNLRNSDQIMWDRQTESWWQQLTGESIAGHYAGAQLTFLPAPMVPWNTFREAHPDGFVLSQQAGNSLPYGSNPYVGYDRIDEPPMFLDDESDPRLSPKERVAALSLGGNHVAYPYSVLRQARVVNDEIGGESVVVFYEPGTLSALDRGQIVESKDVGATAVFFREQGGRVLTFIFDEAINAITDTETGSTWDILGRATRGPLQGERLERMVHQDHFWFAWAAFRPETTVYQGQSY